MRCSSNEHNGGAPNEITFLMAYTCMHICRHPMYILSPRSRDPYSASTIGHNCIASVCTPCFHWRSPQYVYLRCCSGLLYTALILCNETANEIIRLLCVGQLAAMMDDIFGCEISNKSNTYVFRLSVAVACPS